MLDEFQHFIRESRGRNHGPALAKFSARSREKNKISCFADVYTLSNKKEKKTGFSFHEYLNFGVNDESARDADC